RSGLDRGPGALIHADLPCDGSHSGDAAGGSVSGGQQMRKSFTLRNFVVAALLVMLALVPVYSQATGDVFLMTLFTRIVILAMAAVSLNLIMGFGGMVSFGHAAYLGIGGYVVGILAYEGVGSGFIQWPLAVIISALFALVIG